jgi:putative transposase
MKNTKPLYHGCRFPPEIISHAVWLYHRFCLSFRDLEDLLAERGITVSYESIRQWCGKFGPSYARALKRRQDRLGDAWFLDEVFVNIRGNLHYLWRAVDQDGDTIDILMQKRCNKNAPKRFFRKLLKGQCVPPRRVTTDKLKSYSAAHREVMAPVVHSTEQYENNRTELSQGTTHQRERQMRRFKSAGQAQRFLVVHGVVGNLFRLDRYLIHAAHYREFRPRAFSEWQRMTYAS